MGTQKETEQGEPNFLRFNKFDSSNYYLAENLEITNCASLKILNTNCRSLTKHIDEYSLFLQKLEKQNSHFDVLTFEETWLNPINENIACFENFTGFYRHRNSSHPGGGVCIFVRDGLNAVERHDMMASTTNFPEFEGLFVEIKNDNSRNVVVGVVYRPPDTSVDNFLDRLSAIMQQLILERKTIVLCGDFNIDCLKYSLDPKSNRLFDDMLGFGLIPNY